MTQARQQRAPRTSPAVRREQLIRAALPAFAGLGYQGVELQAIADDVGVTRNLIHHYFPGGKHDLYLEAVRAACTELAELLDVDPAASRSRRRCRGTSPPISTRSSSRARSTCCTRAPSTAPTTTCAHPPLATREAIALGIARNHLGTSRPAKALRAALIGFIAFAETATEQWRVLGLRDRRALERLLGDVLVATVAAAVAGPASAR